MNFSRSRHSLEEKYGQAYLPSSTLYEGIEWLIDSSFVDLLPGKTSLYVFEKLRQGYLG
ncbi:MAG: hypothetical protein OWQ52_12870 [Metallosphaera prunae]|nr:hypothetical protein [Metallosphaera prunae]